MNTQPRYNQTKKRSITNRIVKPPPIKHSNIKDPFSSPNKAINAESVFNSDDINNSQENVRDINNTETHQIIEHNNDTITHNTTSRYYIYLNKVNMKI